MAVGYSHTVAVRTDGTLWIWGGNDQGQLGNSTPTSKNVPTKMGTDNDWETVAAGWGHTVALKTDGSLWAWGYGGLGQIGNGSYTMNFNAPQQIGVAKNWQTIVTGNGHTVALKTDGSLWAWGNNFSGQLGIGSTFDRNTPTRVGTANDWQTVVAGKLHTVALKKDGTLWTWGNNTYGALGDGTTIRKTSPKQIGTANNWKTVATGGDHTIAIKTDGTLWAWGDNTYGALGDGTTTNKLDPTQIGSATDWKTIDGAINYTIAVKTDGTLWAWGFNSDGEFGNGTKINSLVPLQIGTENNWQMIDGGSIHTVAIKADESLWTWGSNSLGQLGDGTSIDKSVPTVLNCLGSLIIKTDQINISCLGDTNGSATITSVLGGKAPYSYLWSNGETTTSITGLSAGDYSCTVTDATSFSITKNITISQPAPIAFKVSTEASCNNNNKGNISITATGGTLPYQYAISPNFIFQNSSFFANLSPGSYTVSIKDANGCIVTDSNPAIVNSSNTPVPTAAAQTFNNGATVSNLEATGLNIKWFNDITEGSALNLSTSLKTGKYYVSQTINGCESSRTAVDITIIPPPINDQIPIYGLLAYYPFDGNANDLSGNESNGIATDVTPTADRFGNSDSAYSFNGTTSNIEADIKNYPLKDESRTITGWFKADNPTKSKELDFCLLNYGNVSDPNYWFKISFYRKGYLDIQFDSKTFQSPDNYFNGEWTFFAMVFNDQTNTFSLYINNILTLSGSADLYTNGVGNLFRIGKNKSNNYFEGSIDDIGIWNRILTPEEITALYNVPKPILYTLIPDINFENKLIELGFDEGTPDGKVLRDNIQYESSLNVSSSNISDLTGIEDFEELKYLYCNNNNLTTIDVSKNESLRGLNCANNKISSLNLEKNDKLYDLHISDNKLTSLNLTKNDSIESISAHRNLLATLNLSKNKKLVSLNISYNKLSTLDLSENTVLENLDVQSNNLSSLNLKNGNNILLGNSVNFIGNPNLSCIQIDDAEYSNTNWTTFKDAAAAFNINCSVEYFALKDSNFEQKLIDLGIDTDGLNGKISSSDISAVASLDLSNSNITDLSGIEGFTSLTYLDCSNNQLANLDLTNNVLLETLNASSNQITSLDLSKNSKLIVVYVVSNPLVFLNLQNGNNTNMIILNVTGKMTANPIATSFLGLNQLGCVKVDDAAFSNTNWSKIKETSTIYSSTCSLGIEDSVFDKVVLYPNPTKGELHIDNANLEKATIYNTLGQLVKSFTLNSNNTNNTINLASLPKGVYYLYLINQEAASVKKIIVE